MSHNNSLIHTPTGAIARANENRSSIMSRMTVDVLEVARNCTISLLPPRGVTGHEGTPAHALVTKILDILQLNNQRIHLFNSDQVEAYEQEVMTRNPSNWLAFATKRERSNVRAAVVFSQGDVLIYYDKDLKGKDLALALAHEMGHVVFRTLLNQERMRNTALWAKIYQEYELSGSKERFMEWFADEVVKWTNSLGEATKAKETFFKRITNEAVEFFRALGLAPSQGAVSAYLTGLVLRTKTDEFNAYMAALSGQRQVEDGLITRLAFNTPTTDQMHLGREGGIDFLTLDGVKCGTMPKPFRLGSIWNEPKEWMTAFTRKEYYLITVWSNDKGSKMNDDLNLIALSPEVIDTNTGYICVEYCFSNDDLNDSVIQAQEDDAL